tara:strand:- start:663 stop:4280 length:3618 start_codon:yes stop_codon:yes gene_type:complete
MRDEPTLKNKLSPLIENQLPDFLQDETHLTYAHFVRDFYQFLESARIRYKFSTNYLIQEPETKAYVLSENGILGAAVDRMVLEDSIEFANGEIIKGQTSGAEATVIVEDVRNASLYTTANQRFEAHEIIKGLTSGAEAELIEYKGNPVQNIQQLLEYGDIDNTVWDYFTQFREAFLKVIPNTLASDVSKRNLIKNIKDLYSAKGTQEGHKLFMRLLLNETASIFYPNKNMLRISDGQWKKVKKIRCISNGLGVSSEALNQVITGRTSFATAVVDATSTFQQGTDSISEFEVENVNGTFQDGEIIDVISNEKDVKISFTIKSIITSSNIETPGILHSLSEALVIDSDKGNGFADVIVEDIKEGSVSEVFVQTPGSGYEVGDVVQFTGGVGITSASGIVTAVGGGLLLEDDTGNIVREIGTTLVEEPFNIATESRDLSDGPYYVFGTADYNQLGAGLSGYYYPLYLTQAGAGGENNSHAHTFLEFPNQTFYMPSNQLNHGRTELPSSHSYIAWPPPLEDNIVFDGTDVSGSDSEDKIQTNEIQISLDNNISDSEKLILEIGTFATTNEATEINEIFLTNKGQGYKSLPTISVSSQNGSGAKLLALTNDIGAVSSIRVNDAGFEYDSNDLPDLRFRAHFVLKDITGSFEAGNNLTSHTGQVKGWNAVTQQLDTTFENIVKFDMEQSSAVGVPFVLEDQDSAINENNMLLEEVQDIPLTIDDNIILNGTGITTPPVRTINVDVKRVLYQGASVFAIDSVPNKKLKLKEGNTYIFDLSDSSLYNENSSLNHQLKFSTTPDGTHGGGVEFTTNVTKSAITVAIGTVGAFIQITIPTGSPTLYYYCVNHSGMGGVIETDQIRNFINDENDTILLNGSGVNKFKMLFESPNGENPLTGIAFEDNSGVILLETTRLFPIQDEDQKLVLDGLIDTGTAFILNETSGLPIKNEDHGNKLLSENGDHIVFQNDDESSVGDFIVLNGTDSSSNNSADSLILEEGIDFSNNDVVITDSSGASGTIILSDIATGNVNAGIVQETEGNYISVQSLIDEDLIRIQDSYYYQQFSYEVQVGQSTAAYLNELKKAVHPAGFAPFGKVSIASFISMAVTNAGADQQDPVDTVDSFSPILASTFKYLFDEQINRRHYVVRTTARIGNRTDAILLEDGEEILFEDDTVDMYGLGGKLKAETAHVAGNEELAFIPNIKVVLQSRARSR